MRATTTLLLTLAFSLTVMAWGGDDEEKKDKKTKIPALTFVGNYDGEVVGVDTNSDSLTLKIRDVVPKWVPNNNNGYYGNNNAMGRMNNRMNILNGNNGGGGTYVQQEQLKDIHINLSPDIKVRIMTPPPATDAKKTTAKKEKPLTEKEKAEKDPDYKLGGAPAKKTDVIKGQLVRVAMGRNNDKINPQIYAMAIFVVKEGNAAPAGK